MSLGFVFLHLLWLFCFTSLGVSSVVVWHVNMYMWHVFCTAVADMFSVFGV